MRGRILYTAPDLPNPFIAILLILAKQLDSMMKVFQDMVCFLWKLKFSPEPINFPNQI